jgi:hypothetical protein
MGTIEQIAADVFEQMNPEKITAAFEHCRKLWLKYIDRDATVIRVTDSDMEEGDGDDS